MTMTQRTLLSDPLLEDNKSGGTSPDKSSAATATTLHPPLDQVDAETEERVPEEPGELRKVIVSFSVPVLIRLVATNILIVLQTAYLGHCGVLYLGASALGDIVTNTAGICLQSRVSRNFMALAYGAGKFREVGLWLYTSCVALTIVLIPVLILFNSVTFMLESVFDVEPSLAELGGYYQSRMSWALPATTYFLEFINFFAAQGETEPGVTALCLAVFCLVSLGSQFIFGIPLGDTYDYSTTMTAKIGGPLASVNTDGVAGVVVPTKTIDHSIPIGGFGFYAVPVVWSAVNWITCFFVLGYYCGWKKWHRKCLNFSPCGVFSKIWSQKYLGEYFRRFLPSQAALASDFLRLSFLSAVVAKNTGTTSLSVFKSTLAVTLGLTSCTYALATGASRFLAVALGSLSEPGARQVFRQSMGLEFLFVVFKGICVYAFCPCIAAFFSEDPAFLAQFELIRLALAIQGPLQCLALFCEEVLVTLQKNRLLFCVSLTSSWVVQVPFVWYVVSNAQMFAGVLRLTGQASDDDHVDAAFPLVYWSQAIAYLLYLSFYLFYFSCFLDWSKEIRLKRQELLLRRTVAAAAIDIAPADVKNENV
ncbi:unnamed protein product [Amoebophrya sp. A120]|nr:unnamed protein product [Amoebophrya sp. A120]|eukprot:GSA120T00004435001.1